VINIQHEGYGSKDYLPEDAVAVAGASEAAMSLVATVGAVAVSSAMVAGGYRKIGWIIMNCVLELGGRRTKVKNEWVDGQRWDGGV
jgi:hypothetical protein